MFYLVRAERQWRHLFPASGEFPLVAYTSCKMFERLKFRPWRSDLQRDRARELSAEIGPERLYPNAGTSISSVPC